MKFVLVIVVVLAGVWLWRRSRAEAAREEAEEQARRAPPPHPAAQAPAAMVVCRHCGLHLPAADALAGTQGSYCSADHRQRQEGSA